MKIKILSSLLIYTGLITATTVNASVVINANTSYVDTRVAIIDHASGNRLAIDSDSKSFIDLNIPSSTFLPSDSRAFENGNSVFSSATLTGSINSSSRRPMFIETSLIAHDLGHDFISRYDSQIDSESVFDISFTTDRKYQFNLSSNVSTRLRYLQADNRFDISLTNSLGEFLINHSATTTNLNSVVFSDTLIAPTDQYRLRMSAAAEFYSNDASTSDRLRLNVANVFLHSTFDITPIVVPIPATAWLFGTGILGLIASGRKRVFKIAR